MFIEGLNRESSRRVVMFALPMGLIEERSC